MRNATLAILLTLFVSTTAAVRADDAPKGDKATSLQPVPEAPLAIPGLNPVINTRPNVIVAPATLRNPF